MSTRINVDFTFDELHTLYNSCMLSFACMDRDNVGFAKDVAIIMKKLEMLLRIETSFFDSKRWGNR